MTRKLSRAFLLLLLPLWCAPVLADTQTMWALVSVTSQIGGKLIKEHGGEIPPEHIIALYRTRLPCENAVVNEDNRRLSIMRTTNPTAIWGEELTCENIQVQVK